MSFGGFRTIWIALRASNYTTRAFNDTIRGLKKMQREQIKFKMNAAKNIMAVGIMYIAFGAIAVGALGQVMAASKHGERVLSNFSKRAGKSLAKLGDALAKWIEPLLDLIAKVLEFAVAIPMFTEIAAAVMLAVTGFLLLKGAILVVKGVMAMLGIQHLVNAAATTVHSQTLLTQFVPATIAAAGATVTLAAALQAVSLGLALGFGLVMAIGAAFGKLPAIIAGITIVIIALAVALWKAAGGLSVLTFGAAAIAGGAAIATAIQASTPEYQMGTSFVRQGGLARVHAGEEIISARESKVESRWDTRAPHNRTVNEVTINMGDVHTKADEEELGPLIKRAIRDAMLDRD